MTAPSALDHVTAMKAHLVAQLGAGVPVGIGQAPAGVAAPYVVLYPDPGEVGAITLGGERHTITLHVFVHAVGSGPEQALWAGDKVRTALLDQSFTVPGRRLRRIDQELAPPPLNRDDDVQPPLFLQVAEYSLHSEPA